MNVRAVEANVPQPVDFRAALQPLNGAAQPWGASDQFPFATNTNAAGIVAPAAIITGRGTSLSVDPRQTNAFTLINRAIGDGATIRYTRSRDTASTRYAITGGNATRIDGWARDLGVSGTRLTMRPSPASPAVGTRIGLYKASPGNMDQGWTEWLLDTYGYRYTLLTPADLEAGSLGERFDAIVMASQGVVGGRGGRGGGGGGRGGRGGASPELAALDSARVRALDEFVRGGGTVVAWNQGTASLISALQLPVRNVVAGVPRQEYFTGISIMRALVDTMHPVMSGMPGEADVVVSGSPVFTTTEGFEGAVLAKYPAEGSPLRSGFLNGEERMRGHAAAVDVKRGDGHIVLIAFQPQWRGQPHGTFRVIFNALYYSRDVAANAAGTPGFWTVPVP
jgi:hypothetical protein